MSNSVPDQAEQHLLRQQALIADICLLFSGTSETDAMIVPALRMMGEFLGLSRLMLLNYQRQTLHRQYEWYDQNIAAGASSGVAKLADTEARVAEALARREMAYFMLDESNRADIASRYSLPAAAVLFLPLFCGGEFWGLLEFERCESKIPWSACDISLGQTLAALFSGIISRRGREEHLLRNLREAQEAADQASQAKSNFLSRMSHEMRTPLNAIIGMTDIALTSNEMGKREYCLNQIDNASRHLMNVINDILDMAKMESSQLTLSLDEFDFEQALINIADVVNSLALEKRHDFVVDIAGDVPRSLIGDKFRISQVITNLLTNAIKFTPDGGVIKLKVSRLAGEGDMHTLQVEVADNGIGISEAQQARLFDSFEQGDGSIARKYGGTGLGLAICKYIVAMMDGDIRVSSAINQGSVFTFTMKLQKGKRHLARHLSSNISRSEIRILAVDDSPDIREYFMHIMSALGLPCDVAAGGLEALTMMEAHRATPYNVFFVDWQMPEMDGLKLSKRIRSLCGQAAVIIMITGYPLNELEQEAAAAGVSLCLSKPLFPSNIINGLNECLGVAAQDKLAAQKAVREGGYNFKAYHLLLVEDVAVNREIIHVLLADTQIGIDNAINGRQAVEMFTKNPAKYSLILMDMNMPEMDGYEATRAIRALPAEAGKNIPIIAMTANVFKEDKENCLAAGLNSHLAKPVEARLLLEALAGYLQPADAAAGLPGGSYKPISYPSQQKEEAAAGYAAFLPLLDVAGGLSRAMNNSALYFTLLHNFSGRALAAEIIAHIRAGEHAQTARKAALLRGMAVNLGLSGLQAVIGDIEKYANMEDSSLALIGKLEEMMTQTLSYIEQLLQKEGII
jgi:signal transduction histidine kinase/CheY-like chemotaxis protein